MKGFKFGEKSIAVKLSDDEYEMLIACSRTIGLSKSDVVRKGIKLAHDKVIKT